MCGFLGGRRTPRTPSRVGCNRACVASIADFVGSGRARRSRRTCVAALRELRGTCLTSFDSSGSGRSLHEQMRILTPLLHSPTERSRFAAKVAAAALRDLRALPTITRSRKPRQERSDAAYATRCSRCSPAHHEVTKVPRSMEARRRRRGGEHLRMFASSASSKGRIRFVGRESVASLHRIPHECPRWNPAERASHMLENAVQRVTHERDDWCDSGIPHLAVIRYELCH